MLELSFIKKYSKRKKQQGYVNASLFNTLTVYYFSLWLIKDSINHIKKSVKNTFSTPTKHKNRLLTKPPKIEQKSVFTHPQNGIQKQPLAIKQSKITVNPFIFEEEKPLKQVSHKEKMSFFTGLNVVFILLFVGLFYGANEYFSTTEETKQTVNLPDERKLTVENSLNKDTHSEIILEKKIRVNPFTGEKSELSYPVEEQKDVFQLQEKSQLLENNYLKNNSKTSQNSPKNSVKKAELVDKKVVEMAVLDEKTGFQDLIVENNVNPYQPLPLNETVLKDKTKIKFYGTVSKEQ